VRDETVSCVTNSRCHANPSSDPVFFRQRFTLSRGRLNEGGTIQRFNDSTFQRFTSAKLFLAIGSMSAIGTVCHWNLAPPAATRFQPSIIIAVIVLPHRGQFRRHALMRNTCSK
jgi:hypothetical protein